MNSFFKIALLLGCSFLFGCATGYGPAGWTGGYKDNKIGRNSYSILFAGNAYITAEKAADFCLMRCAELSLENGYEYFIVTSEKAEVDIYRHIGMTSIVPMGYGNFIALSNNPESKKPIHRYNMIAFFRAPMQYTEYFNAKEIFRKMSDKYRLHLLDPIDLKEYKFDFGFKVEHDLGNLKKVPIDDVEVIEGLSNIDKSAFLVGRYLDYELPYKEENDFVEIARKSASDIGANLLVYEDNYEEISSNTNNKNIGFVALAYFKPKSRLGIMWEPSKVKEKKYIVMSFDDNSHCQECGLLIGDRVIKIDGIDVYRSKLKNKQLRWGIDQEIPVTVVRDGKMKVLMVKTIEN